MAVAVTEKVADRVACVNGRVIVQQVTASDGSLETLYLFTTLLLTVTELPELYGQR